MKRTAIAAAMAASFAPAEVGSSVAQAPDTMRRHSIEGQVTSVDAKKRWIHLESIMRERKRRRCCLEPEH